ACGRGSPRARPLGDAHAAGSRPSTAAAMQSRQTRLLGGSRGHPEHDEVGVGAPCAPDRPQPAVDWAGVAAEHEQIVDTEAERLAGDDRRYVGEPKDDRVLGVIAGFDEYPFAGDAGTL